MRPARIPALAGTRGPQEGGPDGVLGTAPRGPAGKVLMDGNRAPQPTVGGGGSHCCPPPLPVMAATPLRGPGVPARRRGSGRRPACPASGPVLTSGVEARPGDGAGPGALATPPRPVCYLSEWGGCPPDLGSLGDQVGLADPCVRPRDSLSQNGHLWCVLQESLQTPPPLLSSGL